MTEQISAFPLKESDYLSLEKSYISREWADNSGIYRVDNEQAAQLLERKVKRGVDYGGVVFPYWCGGERPLLKRIRRDHPDFTEDPSKSNGWKEERKYLIAKGESNALFYYRKVNWEWRKDASIPLYIVEGEKKCLALQRYFHEIDDIALVAGIAGVWGWRTSRTVSGVKCKGLVTDFDYVALSGRKVYVIFDADARDNQQVEIARRRLVNRLRQAGAKARWLEMPSEKDTGQKGIDDLLGAKGKDYVSKWLEAAIESPNDDGYINISLLSVPDRIQAAWRAIQHNNAIPTLFQRDGQAYRMETDDSGNKHLRLLTQSAMRIELMNAATWIGTNKDGVEYNADIPASLPSDMLAIHPLPLPIIDRIIRVPVFAPNGKLRLDPGYDEATRCYLDPPKGVQFEPVIPRDELSIIEVKAALAKVEEMIQDFPFRNDREGEKDSEGQMDYSEGKLLPNANKANALGLFLLPFCRKMIQGATPIHIFDSNENGTGKTLLASCLLYPSMFSLPQPTSAPDNDKNSELEKRIETILMSGKPLVFIDNVNQSLASGTLAAITTAETYSIRPFGRNDQMRDISVSQIFVVTGKNIEASNEISRRTSLIALDTDIADPAGRQGLKNLPEWVRDNGIALANAAHTIIQYWINQGKPAPKNHRSIGSFDEWARVIGGILELCEVEGFQGNQSVIKRELNTERNALTVFIELWYAQHQSNPQPAKELLLMAMNCSSFNINGHDFESRTRSFSRALAKHKLRVFEFPNPLQESLPLEQREIVKVKLVPGPVIGGVATYKLKAI